MKEIEKIKLEDLYRENGSIRLEVVRSLIDDLLPWEREQLIGSYQFKDEDGDVDFDLDDVFEKYDLDDLLTNYSRWEVINFVKDKYGDKAILETFTDDDLLDHLGG